MIEMFAILENLLNFKSMVTFTPVCKKLTMKNGISLVKYIQTSLIKTFHIYILGCLKCFYLQLRIRIYLLICFKLDDKQINIFD